MWVILSRMSFFSVVWWFLTEGDLNSWPVGVVVIVLTVLSSVFLLPPLHFSWLGLLKFIPFFLWHSLLGGIDTAKRALSIEMNITPTLFNYRWSLPVGLPRVFMANIVSLLPGTMTAELTEDYLIIHILDEKTDFMTELKAVEKSVATLFAVNLVNN
jgi:multicomponent Na+:H+ antiporter subunit E